jgi:serine/threonine protein kinase
LVYELLACEQLFGVFALAEDEKDDADDDHLLDLNDIIEPLPESWMLKWPRAHKYFGPNGERFLPAERYGNACETSLSYNDSSMDGVDEEYDGDDDFDNDIPNEDYDMVNGGNNPVGEEEDIVSTSFRKFRPPPINNEPMIINNPLETLFDKHKLDDIDSEEARVIPGLIRKILRYEPSERPTAAELLQHEWFKD